MPWNFKHWNLWIYKRINLCNSRYFWLTQNTWSQLYRVFFCEHWSRWCLVPYGFLLCPTAHFNPPSVSPAVPSDLSHVPPSPLFLLPPAPLDMSFSVPVEEVAGVAALRWAAGLARRQCGSSDLRLHLSPWSSYQISRNSDICCSINFSQN